MMGTLNAAYVRASDPDALAKLLKQYPVASTEPSTDYFVVQFDGFEVPEAKLSRLSSQLGTDVLWLSFQSVVDAFQFHHWRLGARVRSLVYECSQERTWEEADGDPEAWESSAFFDEDSLRTAIELADESEGEELKRVWRERELAPGSFEPSVDARETARAVAEHYKLPGWDVNRPA